MRFGTIFSLSGTSCTHTTAHDDLIACKTRFGSESGWKRCKDAR